MIGSLRCVVRQHCVMFKLPQLFIDIRNYFTGDWLEEDEINFRPPTKPYTLNSCEQSLLDLFLNNPRRFRLARDKKHWNYIGVKDKTTGILFDEHYPSNQFPSDITELGYQYIRSAVFNYYLERHEKLAYAKKIRHEERFLKLYCKCKGGE